VHVGPLPDVGEAVAWAGAREADLPAVVISDPEADVEAVVDLGQPLSLTVEVAVDDASPIYRVELEVDGDTLPGFDEAPPYRFDLALEEGEHTLRARATDAWGNAAWSEPRHVAATLEEKPGGSSSGGEEGESSGRGSSTGAIHEGGGGSGCSAADLSGHAGRSPWLLLLGLLGVFRRRVRSTGA